MQEFLRDNYTILTNSIELIAALTGLILYKKYRMTPVKYFIWFLVYLTFFDTLGVYSQHVKNGGFFNFLEGTVFASNHWLYTLFWKIGAIMFFSFYYSKILKSEKLRWIVKISGYLFLVFSLIYLSCHWSEFFHTSFPIISILGAAIVFMCSVFYFLEILQSDQILTFYKSINFYISFAIFIWWLIVTPLVFYDMYHTRMDWSFIFIKWEILLFANIFMYSTYIFALIWCRPEND